MITIPELYDSNDIKTSKLKKPFKFRHNKYIKKGEQTPIGYYVNEINYSQNIIKIDDDEMYTLFDIASSPTFAGVTKTNIALTLGFKNKELTWTYKFMSDYQEAIVKYVKGNKELENIKQTVVPVLPHLYGDGKYKNKENEYVEFSPQLRNMMLPYDKNSLAIKTINIKDSAKKGYIRILNYTLYKEYIDLMNTENKTQEILDALDIAKRKLADSLNINWNYQTLNQHISRGTVIQSVGVSPGSTFVSNTYISIKLNLLMLNYTDVNNRNIKMDDIDDNLGDLLTFTAKKKIDEPVKKEEFDVNKLNKFNSQPSEFDMSKLEQKPIDKLNSQFNLTNQ